MYFCVNNVFFFRQLKHAREGVSHGGLGLLARHRRRQRLKAMLDILRSLKTLVCMYIFATLHELRTYVYMYVYYAIVSIMVINYDVLVCSKELMHV